MGYALPYRFDDRGWLQFDRLCAALLDLDSVAWEEREFGRVGLVADGVVPPAGSARLAAPTLVIVAWLRRDAFRSRRLPLLLATELERAPDRMVGPSLSSRTQKSQPTTFQLRSCRLGRSASVSWWTRTHSCACASRRCSGSESSLT